MIELIFTLWLAVATPGGDIVPVYVAEFHSAELCTSIGEVLAAEERVSKAVCVREVRI